MSAPAAPQQKRRVHDPLRPPWSEQGLLEVFRHRYILTLLVRREIAARYQGSVLGLLWSYVNPLTQFFICARRTSPSTSSVA
jgi:ABC-2 type transport system permease protein